MIVAARLRRLMDLKHMTQTDVAEAAGMTKQQFQRIASGSVANPGILTVERIVDAMGATMADYYEDGGRPDAT